MDSAKMCGLLSASCLLLLTLLGDPTEACSCAPSHPQTAYCNADVVIRGKFVGNGTRSEMSMQYEIKTTKVYKGSEAMQELRFLHTPAMASVCGYEHKEQVQGEEYVIAGMLDKNLVRISTCSFIQPWAQLTPEQRRGLSLDYSKGCSCQVSIQPLGDTVSQGKATAVKDHKGKYYKRVVGLNKKHQLRPEEFCVA